MANNFVTPRNVTTLQLARLEYNNSLQALLDNFASPGQPGSTNVILEGTAGLKPGMLWYKLGSNTTLGQGRLTLYNGSNFSKNGLTTFRMPSFASANAAIANGSILPDELIIIDGSSRLWMVNEAGTALIDVGIPPIDYTVPNANTIDNLDSTQFIRSDIDNSFAGQLTGNKMFTLSNTISNSTTIAALRLSGSTGALVMGTDGSKRIAWNDISTSSLSIRSGNYVNSTERFTNTGSGAATIDFRSDTTHGVLTLKVADIGTAEATPVWKQFLVLSNSGLTLNSNTIWHQGNDGIGSGLDADLLDGVQLSVIQNDYRANDGATLLTARSNDYSTYTTIMANNTAIRNFVGANDHATLMLAYSNDGATLLTARSNDYSTYTTIMANNTTIRNFVGANDHATLYSAYANDFNTYNTLTWYINTTSGNLSNLKMNVASQVLSGGNMGSLQNGLYSWAVTKPSDAPIEYAAMLQGWRTSSNSAVSQLVFGGVGNRLLLRSTSLGDPNTFYAWSEFWSNSNMGASSGLDSDLLDGQHGSYYLNWTNVTSKPSPVITLSGDATGSVTLGSLTSNTLVVTVADNSHNHTIANITNLASELASKAPNTAGSGINITSNIAVDSTVVRTSGNQSISGVKTFSGNIVIPNGSPSAPGIRLSSEANTGIYRAGAGWLGFSTSGAPALVIQNNGNLRIYDSSGTFYTVLQNQPTANRSFAIPDADVTLVGGTMVPTTGTGATGTWGISITGGAVTATTANNIAGLTNNRALITNGSGEVIVSAITSTEIGYLDDVTSNIQTQLNAKAANNNPSFTGTALFANGSESSPSISFTGDTDTGMYRVGVGALGFATAGKKAVTLDSAGNMRLFDNTGTYSITLVSNPSANRTLTLADGTTVLVPGTMVPAATAINTGDGLSGGGNLTTSRTLSVDATVVRTTGSQTMGGPVTFSGNTIHNDSTFHFYGITSPIDPGSGNTANGVVIQARNSAPRVYISANNAVGLFINRNVQGAAVQFHTAGTTAGNITVTNANTTNYNTSSDYRLKDNIKPITEAIDILKQLKPSNYNMNGVNLDGFIAHELQEVLPYAVSGTKDEVDENGDPVYQGVDYSKVSPILAAALLEAIKRIEELEACIKSMQA